MAKFLVYANGGIASLPAFQHEHRQKRNCNDQQRKERRAGNFLHGFENNFVILKGCPERS